MRLIDADGFKQYLADGLKSIIDEGVYTIDSLLQAEQVVNDFMTDIDAQETIEAVPVVHARWDEIGNFGFVWHCSNCDNEILFETPSVPTDKYCSNCGARMDGD